MDRGRSSGKKPGLGGSLFSSSAGSAPPEIQPLASLQTNITKAGLKAIPAVNNANTEYEKVTNPSEPIPKLPVQASRLSALLKSLSTAEGAVAESIKARQALIEGLQKLIKTNSETLVKEENQKDELGQRKNEVESKRRAVEDDIMRGMSSEPQADPGPEPPRPEIEGLTPPPVESLTPTGTPPPEPVYVSTTGADVIEEQEPTHEELPPPGPPPVIPQDPRLLARSTSGGAIAAAEAANAAVPALSRTRTADAMNANGNGVHFEDPRPVAKRRKMSGKEEDDFAGFLGDGGDGIDDDVAEMLGRE